MTLMQEWSYLRQAYYGSFKSNSYKMEDFVRYISSLELPQYLKLSETICAILA